MVDFYLVMKYTDETFMVTIGNPSEGAVLRDSPSSWITVEVPRINPPLGTDNATMYATPLVSVLFGSLIPTFYSFFLNYLITS